MNPTKYTNFTSVTKKSKKEEMTSIDAKKNPPPIKASQCSIIKETMTIEPTMIGFVAGYKGCNLERIKKIYGVKISLPNKGGSLIILEGPAKMVSAARKDIEGNLSCKTSFFINKDHISHVIGYQGENSRSLRSALNVCIQINKNGEVVVTGTRCEEAKKVIEDSLSGTISFSIDRNYCFVVLGRDGENIRVLSKELNVCINFDKEDGEVTVMGKNREAAKNSIESWIERWKADNSYEEKISVPYPMIGHVIGKNGSNRRRIENTYDVCVLSPSSTGNEPEIILRGSVAEKVLAAKQDILESLGAIFDIDKSFVGLIIGRGGERVLRLEEEYGVEINIGQRDGKAYILGKKERAEAAKDAIISIISEKSKKV